ncbi:MAG: hypothetical protein PVH85_33015 [Desulfobacterales bacterium]|jgi:hypothetical protein
MITIIFKTGDAIFEFDRKAVMECLEHRKTLYEIKELDQLLDVISSQPEKAVLSIEEHQYFGFIALELLSVGKGSVFCENCGKRYSAQELEAIIAGPDDASVKAAKSKNRRFKNLFRKKLKLPGFYGGIDIWSNVTVIPIFSAIASMWSTYGGNGSSGRSYS